MVEPAGRLREYRFYVETVLINPYGAKYPLRVDADRKMTTLPILD